MIRQYFTTGGPQASSVLLQASQNREVALVLEARRRRQILDDESVEPFEPDTPESENAWVMNFIDHLAGVIRNIGGKR
jgi:hypothetical protein